MKMYLLEIQNDSKTFSPGATIPNVSFSGPTTKGTLDSLQHIFLHLTADVS